MARLALLAVLVLALAACGGSDEPAAVSEPAPTETGEPATTEEEPTTTEEEADTTTNDAPPEKPKPLPGLPRFTAGYTEWATLATDIPPRDSDPHLGTKDVFASKERRGGLFPNGTVIVKHARRPDADFIGLIATMRKIEAADPAHNDWMFVEYVRDSPGEPFTELARDSVCWTCHMGAEQADYVWVLAE